MESELKYNLFKLIDGEMPEILRQEIAQVKSESNDLTAAQQLLALCEIFTNKVIFTKNSSTISMRRKKNTGVERSDLLVYGARLIYQLRAFLTQEEIMFHIGVKSQGKYFSSAKIPQSDVMKKFTALGGNKKAVGLTFKLEKQLIQANANDSMHFINKWKRIELLASVSPDDTYIKSGMYIKDKSEKAFQLLQKKTADMKVYYTIKQLPGEGDRKAIRSKYYNLESGMYGFNDGWLWEWYDTIYNSKDASTILNIHHSIDAGNLEPLFLTSDNIPGIKQGDYLSRMGEQVQDKYNNEKIISYNSIIEIMYELTNLLKIYVLEGQSETAAENLTNWLSKTFIPNSSEGVAGDISKEVKNQLFAPMENLTYSKKIGII